MQISAITTIWVLVLPGFVLLDATGPIQVFSTANQEARDAGRAAPYEINLISPAGGLVASNAGISLLTAPLPRRSLAGATLIVSGGSRLEQAATIVAPAVLRWIARAAASLARCCAVCTGAFALARAGLLEQRRAVTHWRDLDQLRRQFPTVRVQDDAIYVKDGSVYTSAGIAAGIDLALSLVEEDLGHAAALDVAKCLVVFLKRPGGQRQFSCELLAQAAPHGLHGRLTHWLRERLAQPIDVRQMAAAHAVSVRTLHRQLQRDGGVAPAQLLLRLRMECACSLLERREISVKQVARQAGFGSQYNLRRAFAAQLGVTPGAYRARFG